MSTSFLSGALNALPTVATSPYALVAYAVAVTAYAVLVWRIARNRALLKNLEKLPEGDRLAALRNEMDAAVPEDITAEDWIRARTHRYYFYGFVVACITGCVVLALALANVSGDLEVTATVYNGKPVIEAAQRQGTEKQADERDADEAKEFLVSYEYQKDTKGMRVEPVMPYLQHVAAGQYVSGTYTWPTPFTWDFPMLSIKVQNNSRSIVLLSELQIEVTGSQINTDPLLVFESPSYQGKLQIVNEGWGPANSPSIKLSVSNYENCTLDSPLHINVHEVKIDNIEESGELHIGGGISEELHKQLSKCGNEIMGACLAGLCFGLDDDIRCLDEDTTSFLCEKPSREAPPEVQQKLRDHMLEVGRIAAESSENDEADSESMDPMNVTANLDILLAGVNMSPTTPHYMRVCKYFPVCVAGRLDYTTQENEAKFMRFKSLVYTGDPQERGPAPPSFQYDVELKAGSSGYVKQVPISQEIRPGETDHFLVRLGTGKSASFDMRVTLKDASNRRVWAENIELHMLVPRSDADSAEKSPKTIQQQSMEL